MDEQKIEISIALLELLAPKQPINDDDQGGCIWCSGSEKWMYINLTRNKTRGSIYADSRPETHFPDCPWVQARKLLELEED